MLKVDLTKIYETHKDIDTLNCSNFDLILYNLGFLPGSDKKVITSYESTLESLEKAYNLINDEGVILIASYIRHSQGYEEYTNIINYLNTHKINYKEYKSEDSFDILISSQKLLVQILAQSFLLLVMLLLLKQLHEFLIHHFFLQES